jgi:ATP-dependent helicase/nuclease subunit A
LAPDLFSQLPPDHAERRRIAAELDTTMIVEAAAGTGKTTSLLTRMVCLLAEGRCRAGEMAAVTFTRKATAELRARFQVSLERELRAAGGEPRARLREALDHVEQCFIGTIHSFCGRLLRERPIEAGVDMAFEELDEDADFRLRRAAWDEHAARLHASGDPLLGRLDDLGLDLDDLLDTYLEFADYPDVDKWPAPPAALDPARAEGARRALREWGRHAESLGDLPRHAGNDTLIPFLRALPRRLQHTTLSRDRELLRLLEDCLDADKSVYKHWPRGSSQGKREHERWSEFLSAHAEPLVEQWRQVRYPVVLDVLRGAVAVYAELRRARGALSYQDLLMKAAALLRSAPHVRAHFRARFTHVLVDEFQDTDPVQAEVLLLLTADDHAERNWRRCRPVPGSLFVVGDPRQSIYRFRRADIVTYNEVSAIIGSCGAVVRLQANFRSSAPLIDAFNLASAALFAQPGECSPPDSPMLPGRRGPEGPAAAGEADPVRVLEIPHARKAEALACEADVAARAIRDALDRREHAPGDFMILTFTRPSLLTYARALEARGIPVEVTGGAAVNEQDEVSLLHAVLAAVVEPDDPVRLAGVLRSEVFGISDAALYRFVRGGGAFRMHPADAAAEEGAEPIAEAFERLRTCAAWFSTMQPVAAAERVAADLGLFARAAAGGAERAGALCKAIELLRSAGRDLWTPVDLVRYLWQMLDPSVPLFKREKHDGLPLRPHEGQAVRLMNLHQAKGLEAPIVFLADSHGEFRSDCSRHISRRGGAVTGRLQVRGRKRRDFDDGRVIAAPADWPHWEAEERRFREAEHDRLLYVAATRAAARLVIGRPEQKRRWEKLLEHMPHASLPEPSPAAPPAPPDEPLPDTAPRQAAAAIERRWEEVRRPTWGERRLKESTVAPGGAARPGEHATEWGSVLHVLLEAAMCRPGADLGALAAAALEEHDLDPGRSGDALEMVQAVMRSELWRRAESAAQRLVEVPLQYVDAAGGAPRQDGDCPPLLSGPEGDSPGDCPHLSADEDSPPLLSGPEGDSPLRGQSPGVPVIVRGVIDLAFREPGGWVIVDYKTDDRDEGGLPDLAARYAPQVRAYASAWARLTGEPVAEAGLFFIRTRRWVPVELSSRAVRPELQP